VIRPELMRSKRLAWRELRKTMLVKRALSLGGSPAPE
jgi:hypothetical protein